MGRDVCFVAYYPTPDASANEQGEGKKREPRCSRRAQCGFGRLVVEDGDSGHIYREAQQP